MSSPYDLISSVYINGQWVPASQVGKDKKPPSDPDPYDLGWMLDEATVPAYVPPPAPKCDCGVSKVYGDKYPVDKHSSWCTLQKSGRKINIYDFEEW